MTWEPHGSNAEYWRDDNPLIQMWYRFGDDLPPNNFINPIEDHFSGLMTDSSMLRAHLMTKLTPEVSFSATSGIAPWSVSGLKCDGSSWTETVSNCVLGQHRQGPPGTQSNISSPVGDGDNSLGYGFLGFGTKTAHSGMMVAGWLQVGTINPGAGPRPDVRRGVWGNGDNSFNLGEANWQIFYTQEDLNTTSAFPTLRFIYKNAIALSIGGNNGTSSIYNGETENATVDNADTPFSIPINEPFFFAFTVHRELHPETQSPDPHSQNATPWGNNASGLLTMYLGTTTSGLFKVREHLIAATSLVNDARNRSTNTQMGIGNFPEVLAGTVQRPLPPNSILDEFVFVNDGYMSFERIEHYMNSGILTFPTANPERPEFVPELPGTDDLRAYFTWDNNDTLENWLANSAPATSGIFASQVGRTGTSADRDTPCPGIRGGSGLQIKDRQLSFSADWTPLSNAQKWHVPIGSGRNHMWPDINRARGFTWIGWMRPASLQSNGQFSSPFAAFFADATEHHGWGPQSWNGIAVGSDRSINYTNKPGGTAWTVSGSVDAGGYLDSIDNNPAGWLHTIGARSGDWSLWAFCIDFDRGVAYTVKDAKTVVMNPLMIAPGSGWSDRTMLDNPNFNVDDRGSEGCGFSFAEAGSFGFPFAPDGFARIDDWAFYDRVLTLPEMSGYANSGVFVVTPVSPLDVSFKQTLGYWKLEGSGTYDPEGISGVVFDDESWYRHHLTNVSGTFTKVDPLNSTAGTNAIQVDTSGAMLSLERVFIGANLDFSNPQAMGPSGFSAGMWMFVPSGDLGTQGNGVSGLPGQRMFMGNYDQAFDKKSWIVGATDNILEARIVLSNNIETTISTEREIPFNEPFFIGVDVQPSGSTLVGRVWYTTELFNNEITQIGADTTFGADTSFLNDVGASGFSLFNAPNRALGFPVGTQGQDAFVYGGAMDETTWGQVKNLGIDANTLGVKSVSTTDPDNISHWKFDTQGSRFIDFGKEQNFVFPINQDGHKVGVVPAIHGSGVIIRTLEYYDTLPFNDQSRRLDLASGNQSWTFLTWVFPPVPTLSDRHYIMAKSDGTSGIQIFTPSDTLRLTSNASGAVSLSENGDLAPDQWNHMAVVFDRDNNEFTTIINGRYAGCAFEPLPEVPVNNSGLALGGRGDQQLNALFGGGAFSGYLDDTMLFSRALTLPEISGMAVNSYDFNDGSTEFTGGPFGAWISGLPQFFISGLIGAFMHGQAQDLELVGGYISGVEGLCIPYGGFMHGRAFASGQIGAFLHGAQLASGVFGHFVHGLDIVSGFFGHYEFGACEANGEFDIVLNFSVVTDKDFDARLGVEKTQILEFDSRLGVIRITRPPECTFEAPLVGELGSGLPFVLTVSGSGIAQDNKTIAATRFTFADFKGAEVGILVSGLPNSGLFEASREFDTPGWYTLKLEVLDSYGYRTSCCRPFLLLPNGSTSGTFINSLPGISLEANANLGSAINTVLFTHTISGLTTTSGLLEYTDFADQQESLVNSTEMPVGTQFTDFVRRHDYTMPGFYCPVWAVSGEFGIVSDTIADGIDYLV